MMRLSARRSATSFGRSAGRIPFAELRALTPEKLAEALSGEPGETIRWITAAAHYGLVEGPILLGQCLLDGKGLPRDPRAALRWFEAAAGAGSLDAANMVGRCHEMGWGAPVNARLAADWYRRAAEGGLNWGQYNLGNLLLRGSGVTGQEAGFDVVLARRAAGTREVDEPDRTVLRGGLGDRARPGRGASVVSVRRGARRFPRTVQSRNFAGEAGSDRRSHGMASRGGAWCDARCGSPGGWHTAPKRRAGDARHWLPCTETARRLRERGSIKARGDGMTG